MAPEDFTEQTPRLPPGSRVLITGISGFVGGRLAERLIEQQSEVRGLIRGPDHAGRAAELPIQLVTGNLRRQGDVARAVDGVDYVFHCAYDVRSRKQNVDGLRNLIEACASRRIARLVQVSTFAVYEPFPDGPLSEQTRDGDRSNAYVDIKLDLERMVFEAVRSRQLSATVIQPAVVYGPFCAPWTKIPAEKLLSGRVILPSQGEGLCNAVYIDDLVDALILAATKPAAIGERFIISGPEIVTWKRFFGEMADAVGADPPEFWPLDRILQAQSDLRASARFAFLNPKHLVKTAIGSKTLRAGLKAALPRSLQIRIRKPRSFSSHDRRIEQCFVPNQQQLAFYSSKAVATSEKARVKLGYRPRFDFQRGMEPTRRYLQFTYGNTRGSAERAPHVA